MPVRPPAPPPPAPPVLAASADALSARTWAEALDLDGSAAERLMVARSRAPSTGPLALQRAFALHLTWQERDLGSARLLRANAGGIERFLIHTTTDGDDSFLELFSAQGALLASGVRGADGAIAWDGVPGAVRERIAPLDSEPSVDAFFQDVLAGEHAGSSSADKVALDELRGAAAHLIGSGFSYSSVDQGERAALLRVLADDHTLTAAARSYALRLGALYGGAPKELRKVKDKALAHVLGSESPFASTASWVSAEVKGRKDAPRLDAFAALLRTTHELVPSLAAPATKTAAIAALRDAGASAAEARKAVEELKVGGAELFVAQLFSYDAATSTSVPQHAGLAVLAATEDGKRVRAVVVPQDTAPPSVSAPREAVASLTGVDRPIDSVTAIGAGSFALEWRPPSGGVLSAVLDVSDPGAPKIQSSAMAPVLEAPLRELLAAHLQAALGSDRDVLGWVGRDDASGPGFVVAHKAPGTLGPGSLSSIRIALGGGATVSAKAIGTSAADRALAQELSIVLARSHAERMVADPALEHAARLEVALRTRYATVDALEALDATSSPVGFDTVTERAQWMLPRVWGDNAVVVTFAKDGTLRVEDVN